MMAVHRPTALRAGALASGLSLVLYAVVQVLGATMIDLWGASAARILTLLAGVVVRVLAGRWAGRGAWRAGADLRLVLTSVSVGGALGWLLFPGLLSLIGLAVGGDAVGQAVRLLADLALWLVCLAAGAASARFELPPLRRRLPEPPARGRTARPR